MGVTSLLERNTKLEKLLTDAQKEIAKLSLTIKSYRSENPSAAVVDKYKAEAEKVKEELVKEKIFSASLQKLRESQDLSLNQLQYRNNSLEMQIAEYRGRVADYNRRVVSLESEVQALRANDSATKTNQAQAKFEAMKKKDPEPSLEEDVPGLKALLEVD